MPALKGHQFTPESPLIPQSIKDGPPDQLEAHIERENERWKVVKNCATCDEPLVQEELVAHRMLHVSDKLRGPARDLASLAIEDRLELFALFDRKSGKLIDGE